MNNIKLGQIYSWKNDLKKEFIYMIINQSERFPTRYDVLVLQECDGTSNGRVAYLHDITINRNKRIL